MATFETEPTTQELYKHREQGEQVTVEKVEAIYLKGSNSPTYLVGKDDVWTAENYLCIRVAGGAMDNEKEIHKIPHDRIRRRKYLVTEREQEAEASNLANTANAEILDS